MTALETAQRLAHALPNTLTDGLQAWYSLDGNLTDSHGNRHGKVLVGTPSWGADRAENADCAMVLNGDVGALLPSIPLHEGSFTIQFWLLDPQRWLIGQGEGKDGRGLHIGVDASGLRCDYWGDNLAAPLRETPGWSFWAITHDGETKTKSIWRDAQCVASKTTTPYLGQGDVTLGRHFSGGGFFIGGLDDVAFWNRALAPQEIADLFNEGAGLSYPLKAT